MQHSLQVGFEDSIANALGMLYERKARGNRLIRVLEDYRRFHTVKPNRHGSAASCAAPQQQLEHLRLRRAALEHVIRSMEAYSQPSS